jgi:hypothetical protein
MSLCVTYDEKIYSFLTFFYDWPPPPPVSPLFLPQNWLPLLPEAGTPLRCRFHPICKKKRYKKSVLGIRDIIWIRSLRSSGCGSGRPKNIQIRRDTDPDGIRKTGTFTSFLKVIKKL